MAHSLPSPAIRFAIGNGILRRGLGRDSGQSFVIEHAWIELAGRIVDPTRWASELAYFPALRFDRDQLLDPVVDCAKLPLGWHSGVSLQDNPAYQQASQDARALAQSRLAQAKEAV